MAKKKQLAGKKTKLAELPLTRALTGQDPDVSLDSTPPALSPGAVTPASDLTRESRTEQADSPLVATYLYLVQELTELQGELNYPLKAGPYPGTVPPPRPPQLDPLLMELALWRARQGLRDLQHLLSS